MKRVYFILAAVVLLAACGSSSSRQDRTAQGAIPWFGEVLNSYRELYLSGNDPKQIAEGMKEVIEQNMENEIPVEGSPYGISIKKAVIDDWKIERDGMTMYLQLIPEEGTDLHLTERKTLISTWYRGPYGKDVWYKAYAGDKSIKGSTCSYDKDKMYIILNIYYKDFLDWKGLDRIVLSENRK